MNRFRVKHGMTMLVKHLLLRGEGRDEVLVGLGYQTPPTNLFFEVEEKFYNFLSTS